MGRPGSRRTRGGAVRGGRLAGPGGPVDASGLCLTTLLWPLRRQTRVLICVGLTTGQHRHPHSLTPNQGEIIRKASLDSRGRIVTNLDIVDLKKLGIPSNRVERGLSSLATNQEDQLS